MEDYRKAKRDNPNLRSPEAMCTQFCVNIVPRDLDSKTAHPEMALAFDQNERFLHTIDRIWRPLRNRRECGWPRQIKEITSVSSTMRPLQAVDLLAWTMNKHHRNLSFWSSVTFLALEHYTKTYDYATIMEQFSNDYFGRLRGRSCNHAS